MRDFIEEKYIIYNLCSTVSLKHLKYTTVTYGLNSFWCNSATLRNNLPTEIKNYIALVEFKNQIGKIARTKMF